MDADLNSYVPSDINAELSSIKDEFQNLQLIKTELGIVQFYEEELNELYLSQTGNVGDGSSYQEMTDPLLPDENGIENDVDSPQLHGEERPAIPLLFIPHDKSYSECAVCEEEISVEESAVFCNGPCGKQQHLDCMPLKTAVNCSDHKYKLWKCESCSSVEISSPSLQMPNPISNNIMNEDRNGSDQFPFFNGFEKRVFPLAASPEPIDTPKNEDFSPPKMNSKIVLANKHSADENVDLLNISIDGTLTEDSNSPPKRRKEDSFNESKSSDTLDETLLVEVNKENGASLISKRNTELENNVGVNPTDKEICYILLKHGTQRGTPKLFDSRGYTYFAGSISSSGSRSWMCTRYPRLTCRASVVQTDDCFAGFKEHNHDGDLNEFLKAKDKLQNSGVKGDLQVVSKVEPILKSVKPSPEIKRESKKHIAGKLTSSLVKKDNTCDEEDPGVTSKVKPVLKSNKGIGYVLLKHGSKKGRPKVFDSLGYTYFTGNITSFCKYWNCSYKGRLSCKGTLSQTENGFTRSMEHTHVGDINKYLEAKDKLENSIEKDQLIANKIQNTSEKGDLQVASKVEPILKSNKEICYVLLKHGSLKGMPKVFDSLGYTYYTGYIKSFGKYWRCSQKDVFSCKGTVVQTEDGFTRSIEHTHVGDINKYLEAKDKLENNSEKDQLIPNKIQNTSEKGNLQIASKVEPVLKSNKEICYVLLKHGSLRGMPKVFDSLGYTYYTSHITSFRKYWTCTQRNRFSCKGYLAQIENGFTRAKEHTHDGDINNYLEAKDKLENGSEEENQLIKSKFKSILKPVKSNPPIQCQSIKSFRGKSTYSVINKDDVTLLVDFTLGFSYKLGKTTERTKLWLCVKAGAGPKCIASVKQVGGYFIRSRHKHNHKANRVDSVMQNKKAVQQVSNVNKSKKNAKTATGVHNSIDFKSEQFNNIEGKTPRKNTPRSTFSVYKHAPPNQIMDRTDISNLLQSKIPADAVVNGEDIVMKITPKNSTEAFKRGLTKKADSPFSASSSPKSGFSTTEDDKNAYQFNGNLSSKRKRLSTKRITSFCDKGKPESTPITSTSTKDSICLPSENEGELTHIFNEMAATGVLLTNKVMIDIVKDYIDLNPNLLLNIKIKRTWIFNYVERHKNELGGKYIPKCTYQDLVFATGNKINSFFDDLERLLKSHNLNINKMLSVNNAHRVFNCDTIEMGIKAPYAKNVAIPAGKCQDNRRFLNILCCINAKGQAANPFIINRGEKVFNYASSKDFEGTYNCVCSDTGEVTRSLFISWLSDHFIKFLDSNNIIRPVVLFLNGTQQHFVSWQCLRFANNNGIILYHFLPYSARTCQPLSISIFSMIRKKYKILEGKITCNSNQLYRVFPSLFMKAYNKVDLGSLAVEGFRDTGICPLDTNVLTNSKLKSSLIDQHMANGPPPNVKIEVFSDDSPSTDTENCQSKRKKRKKGNIQTENHINDAMENNIKMEAIDNGNINYEKSSLRVGYKLALKNVDKIFSSVIDPSTLELFRQKLETKEEYPDVTYKLWREVQQLRDVPDFLASQ